MALLNLAICLCNFLSLACMPIKLAPFALVTYPSLFWNSLQPVCWTLKSDTKVWPNSNGFFLNFSTPKATIEFKLFFNKPAYERERHFDRNNLNWVFSSWAVLAFGQSTQQTKTVQYCNVEFWQKKTWRVPRHSAERRSAQRAY